jgi:hypothetical protein
MHNKELYDLYPSPNITRVIKARMGCAGHVACMGARRGAYRILMAETEGKMALRTPRRSWEESIKLIFKRWDGRHGLD